ncbi:NADP-dependent oxidoreductase [Pseudooceanicola sp.]|uniref:NADP-dependent oxidoreductase n=1 Tax=Pseudooceanicola sp. TaxID=1914328 RepID=UPI00260D026B|nr:NADP-dependent oxidoreductase [Pseudooceanicola sp.]MDF1855025.1 NADP-dependent oxidoreductase [Pseudooceanicola sp.]
MRVMELAEHGGPEVLKLAERPDPVPGAGQVLIEIRAASVNAADWKVRRGKSLQQHVLPHVLGRDFSGVVIGLGEGADLAIGDEVFGVCPQETEGAYASRIVMDAGLVALKPRSLSHVETAAIALAGLTAMVAIEDTLGLKPGENLLVQGGAGGVGGMAVQLGHYIGAKVAATARSDNHDYLRGLGADQPIDYRDADLGQVLGDRDAVFDCVGGDTVASSFAALRPGGRAAFVGSGGTAPEPTRADVTSLRPAVGRSRARMARVAELADAGAWKPPVIETMPLTEAVKAHALSEAGHVRGKIVLIP